MSWNSNGKEANLFHLREPQTIAARSAPQVRPEDLQTAAKVARPRQDVQREELGNRTIAGVNAVGTRVTRTIPAGREGNDQPLVTTTETWRSSDYGVVLLSINDDPRSGKYTHEVMEFQPGEPDAALFRAPEGYTVKDVSPKGAVFAHQ
jgi:hypothetical protein